MSYHFKSIVFFMLATTAPLLQSGGCVVDGMNIWQLSECIACSVGAYFEVTQANFSPNFVITTSGHYKFCENLTGSIIINASDVILDLGNYTLNNDDIAVFPDLSNVIIRNGTIANSAAPLTINGGQNILVENIIIDTVVPAGSPPTIAIEIAGNGTGITLRDITIYNGAPINILFSNLSGTVSYTNVTLENISCINTNSAFVGSAYT